MKNMCQSCGMPLSQDPKKGGSNADGSINTEYCSYCFANGEFTWKDATAEQMKAFCKGKLREMGMSRFMAWFLTLNIPRLKRWKQAK